MTRKYLLFIYNGSNRGGLNCVVWN